MQTDDTQPTRRPMPPSVDEVRQANEDYWIASGASLIRQLYWAIRWAQSEPLFFPHQLDEDTGVFEPTPNDAPRLHVEWLAAEAEGHPVSSKTLAQHGWTWDMAHGDFATMLQHLPNPETAV